MSPRLTRHIGFRVVATVRVRRIRESLIGSCGWFVTIPVALDSAS
jgi:hypothetical protein